MKKLLSILAAFLLIPCIASAVIFRENEQGQMLVTKLNITQYDRHGNLNPNFRSEYEFSYDDDTDDLVKVVWTRWIKGTVHKEVLQREGDELKFSYYINDELQTKHKREYKFNKRDNLISLCKITEQTDSRIGLHKSITILQYTNSLTDGMQRKIMDLSSHSTVYNFIRDIRYGKRNDFDAMFPIIPGALHLYFNLESGWESGFKQPVNFLISDDDIMYHVSSFKEERFYLFKGNLVELCTDDLAKLSTNKYAVRQEYTDIENPTNINVFPLAYQNYNGGLCMDKFIETVTPWYPFKSKFLPLKEINGGKISFDYDINNKGQLMQMSISGDDGFPYTMVVEFEYECDLSRFEPVEDE